MATSRKRTANPAVAAAVPVSFEPNVGQSAQPYSYISHGRGFNLLLNSTQSLLTLGTGKNAEQIGVSFVGGDSSAGIVADQQLGSYSDYYLGTRTYTDVPNYAALTVSSIYPGIGLTYYGNAQGQLEYDLTIAPGADLGAVHVQYTGTAHIRTDDGGNLVLTTPGGQVVVQQAPAVYQTAGTARVSVTSKYALNADGTIGYVVGAYDRSKPLIVDPVLTTASYWGGSGTDTGSSVATDGQGNTYVVGQTASLGATAANAYLAKFNSAGTSLMYIAYFGSASGVGDSAATAVAVDLAGDPVTTRR